MTDKTEMKLVFVPGCFDDFEGTQEELDAFVGEIEKMFADGTFFENATEVDELDEDEIELLSDRRQDAESRPLH